MNGECFLLTLVFSYVSMSSKLYTTSSTSIPSTTSSQSLLSSLSKMTSKQCTKSKLTNKSVDNNNVSDDCSRWKARFWKTSLAFGFFAGNLLLNSLCITIINEVLQLITDPTIPYQQ